MGDAFLYRYSVEFASMTVGLEIGVGKDGKIAHFELHPE